MHAGFVNEVFRRGSEKQKYLLKPSNIFQKLNFVLLSVFKDRRNGALKG